MISVGQLDFMDSPTSHVDTRLQASSTYVRPSTTVPMRNPNDDFKRFNNVYGNVVRRGDSDYQFENPRVYGKINVCCSTKFHSKNF